MNPELWEWCLAHLESELSSQQFNTWIRPLYATIDGDIVRLLAPNRFVSDWVTKNFAARIADLLTYYNDGQPPEVIVLVGNSPVQPEALAPTLLAPDDGTANHIGSDGTSASNSKVQAVDNIPGSGGPNLESMRTVHGVRPGFTFANFVEGKSNQLAKAASIQVAENPGNAYNPLFLYGGVGLGKTHLMQATGNAIKTGKPDKTVVYLHSERFVADMVRALQHNTINEFKCFYRSVDALLIDDIQFFAGKERSQEEFFHTFNALLEDQQQVVLTCDRYPKEVDGLEERLKSRFGWGLTVAIEPPELETRVAILKQKAEQAGVEIPDDVAFFIGQRIRSNVRELEGALRRVIASARLMGRHINHELAKDALKDLLALQDKLVTIGNIQKTVAQYYKVRVADLISKRRSRSIARPRQVAMALAKELTNHSLPEIGDAFGGRDHTTVLHATRKIVQLRQQDLTIDEDYTILLRTLSN